MRFGINPPSTPMLGIDGGPAPEWYRYFVQQRKQGDDITDSDVLTFGPAQEVYPNSRELAVADGELTKTSDDTSVTLGLADTGVVADEYGSPTRLIVVTVDAKGRIIDAAEAKIDVSDVDGTLDAEHGGTGQSAYTIGDILTADTVASLTRIPDVALGNVLKAGGVGALPFYGKVELTADVNGVLPPANGGFPGGGFSGSGTFTNFTIVNGLITSAS